MAITNYTELKTSVAAWLDIGTADISAVVSDLVLTAEKRIMREVRTPIMEVALSDSITTGGLLPVPSDYVELKYAYVNTNPVQYVQMVSPSFIYERYSTRSGSGTPVVMARDGANFIFGPYPSSNYTIKGAYYAHLTAVETSANPLFTSNPDLYLFACLAESEPIIGRDNRIQIWESKYRLVKELVNGEADRSNYSGNLAIKVA